MNLLRRKDPLRARGALTHSKAYATRVSRSGWVSAMSANTLSRVFGDAGMKRATRLAQEHAIGCVLHPSDAANKLELKSRRPIIDLS
jgi:hypothetical protein